MATDGSNLPSGRLSRFAKLASLTARTAGDLALGRAKRALGGNQDDYSREQEAARKMLETLGTLKGAAMKLGQQLAMEADSLPPEAQALVAKLFSQAPPMPYEKIAAVVEDELGDPPDKLYAWFSREPLAAASLGQVHRARLADGTEVAVKVQYPGVAEALQSDLKNAGMLVKLFPSGMFENLDAGPYYEELAREIGAETDYVREARLGEAFARAVADIPELHVPRSYPSYSSSRVLTMEYVEGMALRPFAESDADDEARWRVGRQLALAILAPFTATGQVHGDPHPGNFLVRPDGRLTVLDFGAVKQLSPPFVEGFWSLLVAEIEGGQPDHVGLLESAGFTLRGDRDKANATLREISAMASRPVQTDSYDWGACTMAVDMRRYFWEERKNVLEVRTPAESMLFYRAIGGLANNLKLLRTRGDYRTLCRDLCDRRRRATASS